MKKIQLSGGHVALVDDDMFDYLNQWKWYYSKSIKTGYAQRHEGSGLNRKTIGMHVEIMHPPTGTKVDHVDLDGCNNQRYNLRICTHSQNLINGRLRRTNKSGYKGVCWHKANHSWVAKIQFNGKALHLGSFDNTIDAARAYNRKAIELCGEFARLNDV